MDTTMPTRAAIYTRISQDRTGERAGVTRQFEDCAALAEKLGFAVADEHHFDDNDLSAFTGKTRPGYEGLLAGMKRGEFTAVICWHPDRLYRSLKDLERLIDIADATGVQICSVNGGDIDLSNATGKMIARILGSVSRQESEHKAERQRRANQQRRAAGKWDAHGHVPIGYAKVGSPRNYTIIPDEPAASLIRKAAADVLAGVSIYSIIRDWNLRGFTSPRGRAWRNVTLRAVLLNPVYAGLVVHGWDNTHSSLRHHRVVGPGDWEPLFDKATHDGLVALLSDRSRRKGVAFVRKNMGSGVYVCGLCGGKLYMNQQPRYRPGIPEPVSYQRTYRCHNPRPGTKKTMHLSRAADPIDELVSAAVLAILSQSDIRARLADDPELDLDELRTRRAALNARAEELARMFAAGQIDGGQLGSGTADLRTQITQIDQTLAKVAASSPALVLLDGDPDELVDRWDAASPDIKGKIIDELMVVTVNRVGPGRTFDPAGIDIAPRR